MAGHENEEIGPDGKPFTGLSKYFNSWTMSGRRNVAVATYAFLFMVGSYFYLTRNKKKENVKESKK